MIGMWIGGEYDIEVRGRTVLEVYEKESWHLMDHMIEATPEDVNAAFLQAQIALKAWQRFLPGDKEKIFYKAAQFLEDDLTPLAYLLMRESGSTLAKSRHEVLYSAELLRAAAGEARRLYGDTLPDDKHSRFSLVLREPLGIVGLISPFNAPLALFVKMLAFPLIAGNTVVAKPSDLTPQSALWMVRRFIDAGLPPNALSLVNGRGHQVGQQIVCHPLLNGLTFTGSSEVGSMIGQKLGSRLKMMHLELGGSNPLIIKKDFPVKEAASLATTGSFFHSGQICMASSRILVEKSIFSEFKDAFLEEISSLYFGRLEDEKTFYGPLISKQALEKVSSTVQIAQKSGARLLTGGRVLDGHRYAPTVLEGVPLESDLWQKEVFGPVVSLAAFEDDHKAITLANSTSYGLSAGVLTRDYGVALRYIKELKSGGVHIGSHPFQSGTMTPVGGVGLSGIGRSGGKYSIEHFTEHKWVSFHGSFGL